MMSYDMYGRMATLDSLSRKPLVLSVYEQIAQRIVSGGVAAGEPLPSERDLCQLKVRELPAPALPIAGAASAVRGCHVPGHADGKPVYFLVSKDTPAQEMRRIAFQVVNGRPLSGYEQTMLGLAEAGVK